MQRKSGIECFEYFFSQIFRDSRNFGQLLNSCFFYCGNILGISQSGKLKGVGYDMYLEMLKNRIDELKNGRPHIENDFEISTDLNAMIPESYIADTGCDFSR